MWVFIQKLASDEADADQFLIVFKTPAALKGYLRRNDWSEKQIAMTMDGNNWYDGNTVYIIRYCPIGEVVEF